MAEKIDKRTDKKPRTRMSPEQRKASILDAALSTFSNQAYEQVTLSGIGAACGASEALIHKYFGTKAGLYTATLAQSFDAFRQLQTRNDDTSQAARERVRLAILSYIEFLQSLPSGWARIVVQPHTEPAEAHALRESLRNEYFQLFLDVIGGAHSQVDEYAITGFFGFLNSSLLRWIDQGMPEDQCHLITNVALGAAQGALGDWRR